MAVFKGQAFGLKIHAGLDSDGFIAKESSEEAEEAVEEVLFGASDEQRFLEFCDSFLDDEVNLAHEH